jgi:fermentation-respiration switch protein FrsA (DUF1100 family)
VATVVSLLTLAFCVIALFWALQRRLMYFPWSDVPSPDAVGLVRVESVRFTTSDGITLNGWFVPSLLPQASWTMVVFNGNGGNRALRAPFANALATRGLNVLLFDYRGYGDNAGTPTETGLIADAHAARAFLLSRHDVDGRRIVYFGESLGAAVAIALATKDPPAGLILRSPFTSMIDLGRLHYPWLPVRWLVRDRYLSIDRIARVTCPVLVIAGDRDGIIPIEHSRRLYERVPTAKTFVTVPGAGHNDRALLDGSTMIEAVLRFIG